MCYHLVICAVRTFCPNTCTIRQASFIGDAAMIHLSASYTLSRDYCAPQWMTIIIDVYLVWYKAGNQTSFITLHIL